MSPEQVWAAVNLRRVTRNREPVSLLRIQRILRLIRGAPPRVHRSMAFDRRLSSGIDSRWDIPAQLVGAQLYRRR